MSVFLQNYTKTCICLHPVIHAGVHQGPSTPKVIAMKMRSCAAEGLETGNMELVLTKTRSQVHGLGATMVEE